MRLALRAALVLIALVVIGLVSLAVLLPRIAGSDSTMFAR